MWVLITNKVLFYTYELGPLRISCEIWPRYSLFLLLKVPATTAEAHPPRYSLLASGVFWTWKVL